MKTKEMIEVMQASLEGKPIQAIDRLGSEWEDISNPMWDWDTFNYRVKPKPKYRPFNSAEEVMKAIKEHGDWVIWKETGMYCLICEVTESTITPYRDDAYNYDEMLETYTFADGTPFGKLEE